MRPDFQLHLTAMTVPAPRERTRRTFAVQVTRVADAVMAAATELAGGDASRLRPLPDGSVRVLNRGRES